MLFALLAQAEVALNSNRKSLDLPVFFVPASAAERVSLFVHAYAHSDHSGKRPKRRFLVHNSSLFMPSLGIKKEGDT